MTQSGPQTTGAACLVVGAGDYTGGAIGRAFAREGYRLGLVRRPRLPTRWRRWPSSIRQRDSKHVALGADARDEDEMVALFESIETEIAPIEVAVFNIGANVRFPVVETTARVYRKVGRWRCSAAS